MKIDVHAFGIAAAIEKYTKPIRIKDAMMGTGKSTGVIDELKLKVEDRKQYDEPTLIVLPYLAEIERFKDECPGMGFKEPSTDNGCATKTDDLKRLLLDGENILCTHALFELWDSETAELIERGYYHIIIDEEVNCLKPLATTATTIKELKELGLINVCHDTKRVHWDFAKSDEEDGEYYGAKEHKVIRRHCMTGSIYMYGKDDCKKPFIVWEVPYRFFQIARSYTILTYRFESSDLSAFFRTHDIDYEIEIVNPERQAKLKASVRRLVSFLEPPPTAKELTKGRTSLSISWYKRCSKKNMTSIRNSIGNYLRRTLKVKPDKMLYTCPKAYSKATRGKHMAIPAYAKRHIPAKEPMNTDTVIQSYISIMYFQIPMCKSILTIKVVTGMRMSTHYLACSSLYGDPASEMAII